MHRQITASVVLISEKMISHISIYKYVYTLNDQEVSYLKAKNFTQVIEPSICESPPSTYQFQNL